LVKGDVQASYKKWVLGASVRYNSFMQNIDRLFEELDTFAALGLLAVSPGLTEYRKVNNKGALVFDARLGYQLNSKLRFSLVLNNILNNEYTLRPMVVEQPRTTALQLSLKF
jgi:iron complex outermembrane receptor protein